MSSIAQKVYSFMLGHAMLSGSRSALIAVSGGPDSIGLLDILVRLLRQLGTTSEHSSEAQQAAGNSGAGTASSIKADPGPGKHRAVEAGSGHGTQPGFGLILAHLNHKLRGKAADDDARFVSELAVRLGLPAILGAADVTTIGSRLKIGIEEAARAARYSFLFRAARVSGADRIITGHTMNDQVETFMMRALRGSGTAGLAGMAPVRPAHRFEGIEAAIEFQGPWSGPKSPGATCSEAVLLIRPALCLTREEIEQYCRERSLEFRLDASNLKNEFTRNRIRQEVIPALCGIEPQTVRSIARTMEILGIDNEALDQLAARAFEAARKLQGGKEWRRATGVTLMCHVLASQPRAIQKRVILKALREVSSPGHEMTSTHIEAVDALILGGRSGKQVELAGGVRVWRERDRLVIEKQTDEPMPREIELTGTSSAVMAGGFLISLERSVPQTMFEEIVNRAKSQRVRDIRDWTIAVLDDSLIPDTLIIRSRRPGERAQVIGQTGVNKLKKLMISHKIPVSRRASWPLAFTRDSRYVWSPGMPPSVEFAVNRETRSLAILSATEE
jgi:tRNA(Ile)-lysidine synthase